MLSLVCAGRQYQRPAINYRHSHRRCPLGLEKSQNRLFGDWRQDYVNDFQWLAALADHTNVLFRLGSGTKRIGSTLSEAITRWVNSHPRQTSLWTVR